MASGLRKRNKNSSSAKKTKKDVSKEVKSQEDDEEEKELTYNWRSHWLFGFIRITVIVCIPYAVYLGYLMLFLQYPLPGMRPAVRTNDTRQLLVVGSMSTGTTQVAKDLKQQLGLEIGHEHADATWSFVRDGTVSWFHGIRFFSQPVTHSALHALCTDFTPQMGFHPKMFRSSKCSDRDRWSLCWARECIKVVSHEWGCAPSCPTPFARTLHQVRHPLRTMESLTTKFCIGGVNGKVQPDFVKFANALFDNVRNYTELSCVEASGYFVVDYTTAMLEARQRGLIDDWFKIEEASPCSVAKQAGFLDEPIYAPYGERLGKLCTKNKPNKLMVSNVNVVNIWNLTLTLEDLEGGKHGSKKQNGDKDLVKVISSITKDLDYAL